MQPEDVETMLRSNPFMPLAVRLKDGTTYEVRFSNMALVARQQLGIGLAAPNSDGRTAVDFVILGWSDIESVDRLETVESIA